MNHQKRHEEIITDGLCSLFAIPGICTPAELKAALLRHEAKLQAEKKPYENIRSKARNLQPA